MTTPKTNPTEHYKHFRKAIAFPFQKLELCRHCRFRAWSFSGLSSRIQVLAHMPCYRHGHFTLKQLRLPVLNETHTNSYTGPRLLAKMQPFALVSLVIRVKFCVKVKKILNFPFSCKFVDEI